MPSPLRNLAARAAVLAIALIAAASGAEPMIRAGANHAVYLDGDGTVWTWGSNDRGQLGVSVGSIASRSSAAQVNGVSRIAAVAAGDGFTVALAADGTVWTWGRNDAGQLGNGSLADSPNPAQIPTSNVNNIIAIAAGTRHVLALRGDGRVIAWGGDLSGQCGDGATAASRPTPALIGGIDRATAIGAGASHSLALRADGTVWTWGDNGSGQLGYSTGAQTFQAAPAQISAVLVSAAMAVAGGNQHSLILLANGQLKAMGKNDVGQLGIAGGASPTPTATPTTVVDASLNPITSITAIACGLSTSYALRTNGAMYSWGADGTGQLGDGGADANRSSPVSVTNLGASPVRQIAAGGLSAFALRSNGTLCSWGDNGSGQLGIAGNTFEQGQAQPATVTWPLLAMMQVDGGNDFTVALKCDGTVWTCGANASYQLGTNGVSSRSTMAQVAGISDVVRVIAGSHHCLVLKGDGTVWAWGQNGYGQVSPLAGSQFAPTQLASLNDVRAIAVGAYHNLAIKGGGSVVAWGADFSGQLGDNVGSGQQSAPVAVGSLVNVVAIECGYAHSIALDANGRVWTWGSGAYGEIGDGGSAQRNAPVQASNALLTVARGVAAGEWCSFAVGADGSLWSWGYDANSRLGNGGTTAVNTPAQIFPPGSSWVVGVSAGGDFGEHGCALLANGSASAWGRNTSGDCGVGSGQDPVPTPTPFSWTNSPLTRVAAGDYHTLGVTADGRLVAAGNYTSGQCGIASVFSNVDPARAMDSTWYPVITIAATTPTATESGQNGVFTISRSTGFDYPLVISMSGTGGSAASGADYVALPSTVTLPAGASGTSVAVVAIDDAYAEDDETVLWGTLAGAGYSTSTGFATVTIQDNDTCNVVLSPASGLTTTENVDDAHHTARFSVVLTSRPLVPVSISFSSSNPGEGTILPTSVSFGTGAGGVGGDWNVPQTITITGVDDFVKDGDIPYSIVAAPAVANGEPTSASPTRPYGDTHYSNKSAGQVSAVNLDDDVVGIVEIVASSLTHEDASLGQGLFRVKLRSQPTANVTIGLSSSNTAEGLVSPSSVSFTPANWDVLQDVTVTGVDDQVADDDVVYKAVLAPAISSDNNYNNFQGAAVQFTNVNNDTKGFVLTGAASGVVTQHTTESGGTATLTIALKSQPTGPVIVSVVAADPSTHNASSEGVVSAGSSLTFYPSGGGRWDVPQTVTLKGLDDNLIDGTQSFEVRITAAGADYASQAAVLTALNDDNDTAAIVLSPAAIQTNESDVANGVATTVGVRLSAKPASTVTVTLSAHNPANPAPVEVKLVDSAAPTPNAPNYLASVQLAFDATNWNTAQPIYVQGQPDAVRDGDQTVTVNVDAIDVGVGGDANFAAAPHSSVSVVNKDQDGVGIIVTPTSGLVTTEHVGAQHTTTFSVRLVSAPDPGVTVTISGFDSDDHGEGTVSPSALSFTSQDYSTLKPITVTGVDDSVEDGNKVYHVSATTVTAPGDTQGYATIPAQTIHDSTYVTLTNLDDDVHGVVVSPTSGLTTTEAGGVAAFTVRLTSAPSAGTLRIPLTVSDSGEGSLGGIDHLDFTSADWSSPQVVLVTGVDDAVDDGDKPYSVRVGPITDVGEYQGYKPSDVALLNLDNDANGLVVTASGASMTVAEGAHGGPATADYQVALTAKPTGNVTVSIDPGTQLDLLDLGDAHVLSAAERKLTFTAANWQTPQTVRVAAFDDDIDEGDRTVTIGHTCSGGGYDGVAAAPLSVPVIDDDTAGVVLTTGPVGSLTAITSATVLRTRENGSTFPVYHVRLATQPTANVTVLLASTNTAEGKLQTSRLTFTPTNWSSNQDVTVIGVDDSVADGSSPYAIQAQAVSADSRYDGMSIPDVSFVNDDDDTAGVTLSKASASTTEAGGSDVITIRLTSQPLASVVVSLSAPPAQEGVLSSPNVTFSVTTWNVPQTITITGVDDAIADRDAHYSLTWSISSADADYNTIASTGHPSMTPKVAGVAAPTLAVTNADDDTAGVLLSSATMTTSEDATQATVYAVLTSQPLQPVTLTIASPPSTEGDLSASSVQFDASNWNVPQAITVTGVDDDIADGTVTYHLALAVASGDGDYQGIIPVASGVAVTELTVHNLDNDAAGFVVTPTAGLITSEGGGTASFTVRLTSKPLDDIDIHVSSDDATEGTPSTAHLIFTPANWSTPQTVVVTGQDDQIVDHAQAYHIVLDPPTSVGDALYPTLDPVDVAATNLDDDVPGVAIITPVGGVRVSEGAIAPQAGVSDVYSVVLATDPGAAHTVTVTAAADRQVLVDGGSSVDLQFTGGAGGNWHVPQPVTVTAAVDQLLEASPHLGAITHTVTGYDTVIAAANVNVAVTNDDPPYQAAYTPATIARGGALRFDATRLMWRDAEEEVRYDVAAPARVTYVLLLPPGQGVLSRSNVPLASGDTFTQQDIADGHVRYAHSGGAGATDGFAFHVQDSAGNQGPLSVFSIAITGFNAPVVAVARVGALPYVEGDLPTQIDGGLDVSDTDSVNFDTNGRLTVDIAVGFQSEDELTVRSGGAITVSGTSVFFNGAGTAFGTYTAGIGQPLTVNFRTGATQPAVAALLDHLYYEHHGKNPVASKTVRIVVRDDTSTSSAPALVPIAVTPVDDAPQVLAVDGVGQAVIAGATADQTLPTLVTAAGVARARTLTIGDADDPDATLSITAVAPNGVVTGIAKSTDTVPTTAVPSVPGVVTFTYTPKPGYSGRDSFTVRATSRTTGAQRDVVVPIAITGGASTYRPWIASDPPLEIDQAGTIGYHVTVDMADYAAATPPVAPPATLTYALVDVPAGAILQFQGGVPTIAVASGAAGDFAVDLTIVDNGVVGGYLTFGIMVTDAQHEAVGYQPVTIHIVPAGGGGG